jgi:peptidyl-prolyl cis-trans isomerase C
MRSRVRTAFLLLLLPACTVPAAPAAPRVARGEGVSIPTAELQARIDGLPPEVRARYASIDPRRELLDSMILLELMAREAERAGLGDGPDFKEGGKKRMVQRLVQQRFHDPEGPRAVPDAEIREYYDRNVDQYVQPVRMRVAHITLEAPEGAPLRRARKAEAEKLRARLARETANDPDAFEAAIVAIARKGDPETQGAFLDLLSREQVARAFTPEIAEVAWSLPPGQPSQVLSSPRGFHVLQGYGGQPEMKVSLDQARGGIQVILYQARMAEAYRQWTAQLREKAQVRVDEAELARVGVTSGTYDSAAVR